MALRDHLRGAAADRLCESSAAMEPPSLHAEDLVDELYDREMAASLPQDAGAALHEIEAALDRLNRGVYGQCESTGRSIPRIQLRARPWQRTMNEPRPPTVPNRAARKSPTRRPVP